MNTEIEERLERLEQMIVRDRKSRHRKKRKHRSRSRSISVRRHSRHRHRDHDRRRESSVPERDQELEIQELQAEDGEEAPNIEQDTGSIPPETITTAEVAGSTIPENEISDEGLDTAVLDILGVDPTHTNSYAREVQKDLAIRLEHTVTTGLTKESRKEIKDKYLLPSNCKLIGAPALNPELKAAASEIVLKRDKAIELKQKQLACSIACLGQAITRVIPKKDPELLQLLMDAERLICDVQHSDSMTRRHFIISSVNKDMKDQLESTIPDNFLFGKNLTEALKTAKAISKSGADFKASQIPKPAPAPRQYKRPVPGPSNNLNWKSPHPARRQMGAPRTKAPVSTRNLQSSYSGQSWGRQQYTRRR